MSQLGLCPTGPDAAGCRTAVVGHCRLAQQRLWPRGAEVSATAITSSVAVQRALADQHRHPLARIEDVGRLLKLGLLRDNRAPHSRRGVAPCGVLCGCCSTASMPARRPGRSRHVPCARSGRSVTPDRPKAARGGLVDLLAERRSDSLWRAAAAWTSLRNRHDRAHERLSHDRPRRLMVELAVIEPVEQVDRPRARRRHAHPDLTGELRVTRGHKGRHLLVPRLHEPQPPPDVDGRRAEKDR